MPHIHTDPGQHDMTVSAYIVHHDGDELKCLVHMHKKLGVLMQIGGHIELNESPWQSICHELIEESGYTVGDIRVLQPTDHIAPVHAAVVHPVPCLMNTHKISDEHYHSDLCYAFVADALPTRSPGDGESVDLRWMTVAELYDESLKKNALKDVAEIYETIVNDFLPTYKQVETTQFSLKEPAERPF